MKVSYHLAKFDGRRYSDSRDISGFSLPSDLARPRDQKVMWIYTQDSIKVS